MDSQILLRSVAKAQGLSKYFTGSACSSGHIAHRYTVNGSCVMCASPENKKSYHRNVEARRERNRLYYQNNKSDEKARIAAYIQANSAKYAAHCAAWRAARKSAMPSWLSPQNVEEIKLAYLYAKAWSRATGVSHDVDHIIPLRGKTVSGLHVPWNLQVIPAVENRKKSNRLQTEYHNAIFWSGSVRLATA